MTKNEYDQPSKHEDRAHAHVQQQAALAGAELDKLVAAGRAAWAAQTPHAETDSLGRSWSFGLVHEPHPALTVTCGDVRLGVLQTAFGADNPSPDPLREAVVDIDKAVPASPQP